MGLDTTILQALTPEEKQLLVDPNDFNQVSLAPWMTCPYSFSKIVAAKRWLKHANPKDTDDIRAANYSLKHNYWICKFVDTNAIDVGRIVDDITSIHARYTKELKFLQDDILSKNSDPKDVKPVCHGECHLIYPKMIGLDRDGFIQKNENPEAGTQT